MKTKLCMKTVFICGAVIVAAIALLGACVMEPSDGSEDTGTVAINVPLSGSAVNGSSVSASAITEGTVVRVWMYTPQGNEFRLAPTGTSLPTGQNYVETTGGGSIVIDNIPAGENYGLIAVVGEKEDGTFVPDRYALEGAFTVVGGQETQLSLRIDTPMEQVAGLSGFETGLKGKNLNSVVVVGTDFYAATSSTVYDVIFEDDGIVVNDVTLQGSPSVNSISTGEDTTAPSDTLLINTSTGIQYFKNNFPNDTAKNLLAVAGVNNITGSGTFLTDADEVVVYYQRLGGLGGASETDLETLAGLAPGDWNDSGSDLSDVVADTESPILAMATSGNAAYISSVVGAFRAREEVFTSDIDVDALLGGASTASELTFFEVAYPGTSRSLRIREIGVSSNGSTVIVGTGRGAFFFPRDAIGSSGSVSGVQAVPQTDGQYIVDMAVADEFVAVLTPSRLVVAKPGSGALRVVPLRAVTLGNPQDLAMKVDGDKVGVYIAGSDGLSKIEFAAP